MKTVNSPHAFQAFTQGKRRINRTFFDIRKRTVNTGFTWCSPFGKIDGERGFSCRASSTDPNNETGLHDPSGSNNLTESTAPSTSNDLIGLNGTNCPND